MARFRINRKIPIAVSGALTYDTRWGTATNANGWITFGLPGGCRRVWVDSSKADDSGGGLTAATAKKTMAAAVTLFKASWTVGDQIMVAGGTTGGTYTTPASENFIFYGGSGPSLMTAIQSYDRADPTGTTTPYGELVGVAMPVVSTADPSFFAMFNVPGTGYLAFKGIEIKDVAPPLGTLALSISWQTNDHPGMVYQNVRFNGIGTAVDPATGTYSAGTNTQNGGLISKCSQWNCSGLYLNSTDSFRIEDFVTAHNGYDINATRDDPIYLGGPSVFAHAFYIAPSNTNVSLKRIVCVDADRTGARSGAVAVNQLVAIDNPFSLSEGPPSGQQDQRPDGGPWRLDDAVVMGSDKQICPGSPGGVGMQWGNAPAGSYCRNVALFDNDDFDVGLGYRYYVASTRWSATQIPQYMLCDKWSAWRFATVGESDIMIDDTNSHLSWSNSILDVVPTGFNGTVTTTTQRVTPPAGYKTRAQTYVAMGYASKSAALNAMLWRPDLPWAQVICGISLPSMGLTPLYPTVAPPTAITGAPVVYKTSATDLTASSLNFTRGVPKAIVLSGIVPGSYLSCASFPAGFSNTPFRLTSTGTATPGSNVITGVNTTAGILPGMLIEMKNGAYAVASLFPIMSVVVSKTATTITVSNNATAANTNENIFTSAGGRLISYDGSGTGAASPVVPILESPLDSATTSHTTNLTFTIT